MAMKYFVVFLCAVAAVSCVALPEDEHDVQNGAPAFEEKPHEEKPHVEPEEHPEPQSGPGRVVEDHELPKVRAATPVDTKQQAAKDEIIKKHNDLRKKVQSSDMTIMSWEQAAADKAQAHANKCVWTHDSSDDRKLPKYGCGQNMARGTEQMSWSTAIQRWYDEVKDFSYGGDNDLGAVGHYTQVMWAGSNKVGCGYAKCSFGHFYVCNYCPPGNYNLKTPYAQGKQNSACKNGVTDGLCNPPKEDPNCNVTDLYNNCAQLFVDKSKCTGSPGYAQAASGCKKTCTCKAV